MLKCKKQQQSGKKEREHIAKMSGERIAMKNKKKVKM